MKTIPISGVIGWDVSAKDIRAALDAAAGGAVEVQISSPGGIIFDGLEIFNLVRNYRGAKTTRLMGMAASMASYIAMAGDRVVAEDNVVFMIHGAQGVAIGDRLAMEKMASILSGFSGLLAKKYSEKSGKSEADILALMDEETWYFGQEAKDAGFIDEIVASGGGATDKSSAMASAKASVAMASARSRDSWPADGMEKAAALLGGLPAARREPAPRAASDGGPLGLALSAGWTHAELALAFRSGLTLGDCIRQGPPKPATGFSPRTREMLIRGGSFTAKDLDEIERQAAAECREKGL